jgi:EAL domain-containing protein (putative c-di-GMP-specific phosphodiesterase class I)
VLFRSEALLRWRHPRRGLVAPGDFISVAEETGLIVPIGEWVLRQACAQARSWQDAHPGAELSVSVNLSGLELQLPGMPDSVRRALQETGLGPEHLMLEVTENQLMERGHVAADNLGELTSLGIKLVIDDFGTGYSSLARLQAFAVDFIKVPPSFIHGTTKAGRQAPLVEAIIVMAHGLGIGVIAEGVETAEQLAFLRAHHCDGLQGFYIGRPVEAVDVEQHLASSFDTPPDSPT